MKNKEKLLFVWVMLAAVNTFGGNPKWEIGSYTLYEGRKLKSLSKGDSKLGDGDPWKPTITVSGGDAAFYSIGVSK